MTIPAETLKELTWLRNRVEELEYELAELKVSANSEVANLMDYYNLTVSEGRIVRAMAQARGAPVDRNTLAEVINLDQEYIRTIDSHIKRIRAKNRTTLLIDSIYGLGYRLVPDVAEFVRDIMAGKVKPPQHRTHYYVDGAAA